MATQAWGFLAIRVLLEPLISLTYGLSKQRQIGVPFTKQVYSDLVGLYQAFMQVSILWRIHIVLRLFKISFIIDSFSARPQDPADLPKWYTSNVLQAIHAALCILDWVPGLIFRSEIFRPDAGPRIKLLWRIYICATSFQVASGVVILVISPKRGKFNAVIQMLISAFNFFYCVRIYHLGFQLQGLRPKPAVFDAPYEPFTIDHSYRDQTGHSVIHDERSVDAANGTLSTAFQKQQERQELQTQQEEMQERLQVLQGCQKVYVKLNPEELAELQELKGFLDLPHLHDQPGLARSAEALCDSEVTEDDDPGEGPSQISTSQVRLN